MLTSVGEKVNYGLPAGNHPDGGQRAAFFAPSVYRSWLWPTPALWAAMPPGSASSASTVTR